MSFNILIADDEPIIRQDLRELLNDQGYRIIAECADGDSALRLIEEKEPDVVILDIKMPGIDGIDVAKRISTRFPVIILTAYSDRELIQRAKDSGVMTYLMKPINDTALAPAIELAVNNFMTMSNLSERVNHLKEQLETRKLVEKAKGILIKKEGISEPQAYQKIQQMSMKKNIPMKDIAQAIVITNE